MRNLILLLAFCFVATTCFSQTEYNQQQLAENFISIYNTGDTAQYTQFLQKVSGDAKVITENSQRSMHEFQFIGKVHARKIERSAGETDAWLQSDNYDSWWKLVIKTDSAQKFIHHHMQYVGFGNEFLQAGVLSKKALADSLDGFISRKLVTQGFSGNVFLAKGNEILFEHSYGHTAEGKPNTPQQDFNLASMGKLFTTVAILQLKDSKWLALDDTVGRFLPQIRNNAVSRITVRQLLMHTSGMGDFFEDPLYEKLKDSLKHPSDFMPFFQKEKLKFESGKGFAYSNTAFELLGAIIEKITGNSFTAYVQQNIFKKVGMHHSICGGGAGGGRSTTKDLQLFAQALLQKKLLSTASNTELLSYTNADGRWGLGSMHHILGNEHITGHSGGFENVCTELNIYTRQGYIVVILSNSNPPHGHYLSEKIKEWLVRKDT